MKRLKAGDKEVLHTLSYWERAFLFVGSIVILYWDICFLESNLSQFFLTCYNAFMIGNFRLKIFALIAVLFVSSCGFWVDPNLPDTISSSELENAFVKGDYPLALGQTNVVLIITCTMRKNHLESFGYSKPTSPFARLWSENGIAFDSHIAQAPWTRPSIGSIITGRYPRVLRLDNPGNQQSFRMLLRDDFTTMAEVFQSKGYKTYGAVGNPNAKIQFGLGQGFDKYHEPSKTFKEQVSLPSGGELVEYILSQTDKEDAPFFAELVFVDTHRPVQAPRKYMGLFEGSTKRVQEYDASVRKLDGHIAELVSSISQSHPNTLFVWTADHGEGLKEPKHHGAGHGKYLYQTVIGVPHFWSHPSFDSPGRRVASTTRNIDILPTLIDLFGIAQSWEMDGESFASILQDSNKSISDRPAFTESYFMKEDKASIIFGGYHFARNRISMADKLFLHSDWEAKDNLVRDIPEKASELGEMLSLWDEEIKKEADKYGEAAEAPLDAETRKMLEVMGYIDHEE